MTWATLHPLDAQVRERVPVIHVGGDIVFLGRGSTLNDVNIDERLFGSVARSVHFWHMELYPRAQWLYGRDWTHRAELLSQRLRTRSIARTRLTDGPKVWITHFDEELQCGKLTRHVRSDGYEYIELYHGDTIHLVPPRLSWQLSFTLRADGRRVKGWQHCAYVDEDEDTERSGCASRPRKRRAVVRDTDTSSEE